MHQGDDGDQNNSAWKWNQSWHGRERDGKKVIGGQELHDDAGKDNGAEKCIEYSGFLSPADNGMSNKGRDEAGRFIADDYAGVKASESMQTDPKCVGNRESDAIPKYVNTDGGMLRCSYLSLLNGRDYKD